MSDFITLDDGGTIGMTKNAFEQIGDEKLGIWVRWATGYEADKLVKFIQQNYVSGQRIQKITGEVHDHIGAWLQKKSNGKRLMVEVIRPGKGIQGTHNFIGRWTGTEHEFMQPAFRAFGGTARFANAIRDNVEKMMDRELGDER